MSFSQSLSSEGFIHDFAQKAISYGLGAQGLKVIGFNDSQVAENAILEGSILREVALWGT